jgi:uncharacterized protein (TIGR02246 family)
LLLLTAACAHGSRRAPATAAEVRGAIAAANARFSEALRLGDAKAIANLFDEDGEAIPAARQGFVSGRAALEAYYASRILGARFLQVDLTTLEVEVDGELAWETGTNAILLQPAEGPPVSRSGRYLVVWKRGADGQWRIRVDAVIADPPPEPSPK